MSKILYGILGAALGLYSIDADAKKVPPGARSSTTKPAKGAAGKKLKPSKPTPAPQRIDHPVYLTDSQSWSNSMDLYDDQGKPVGTNGGLPSHIQINFDSITNNLKVDPPRSGGASKERRVYSGSYRPSELYVIVNNTTPYSSRTPSCMGVDTEKIKNIYTVDSPEVVEKKIKKYAFSGGQPTLEEHRKKGGNPDIDISYQWLRMMFEPDDKKLEKIYNNYKSGKLLSGELKQILIEKVNSFLKEHQKKREQARKQVDKFIFKN